MVCNSLLQLSTSLFYSCTFISACPVPLYFLGLRRIKYKIIYILIFLLLNTHTSLKSSEESYFLLI